MLINKTETDGDRLICADHAWRAPHSGRARGPLQLLWVLLVLAPVLVLAACGGRRAAQLDMDDPAVSKWIRTEPAAEVQTIAPDEPASGDLHGQRVTLEDALAAAISETGADATSADLQQVARVDLNNDGVSDRLVLLQSAPWCEPEGCVLMVFEGVDGGFRFVSSSASVRGPIGVSHDRSEGWRNLVVRCSDGAASAKTVALSFDGVAYPADASAHEALKRQLAFSGELVLGQ
jgi:hypothetical protein